MCGASSVVGASWDEPAPPWDEKPAIGHIAASAVALYAPLRIAGVHMTTFDDREQAFENKFAHDQDLEFRAAARRNRMLGLWAASLMGLGGDHSEQYASAVVKSDLEQPGDEDVLRKVWKDLSASGAKVTEGAVRAKMEELLAVARDQIKQGV